MLAEAAHEICDTGVLHENTNERSGLAALSSMATVKHIKAGETLYVEGDEAPYCYEVKSGIVKEYNTLEDGRRQVADFYSVGEFFGISELNEQLHTAEAITDCAIRCYQRDAFVSAVSASPQLSNMFLDTLMTRLHRARERIVMLGRMSAIQRIASFLIRLSQEQGTTDAITLQMSRQDIADHLGLTIETVCRTLTELKKREIIVMANARKCTIEQEERLDDIVHNSYVH